MHLKDLDLTAHLLKYCKPYLLAGYFFKLYNRVKLQMIGGLADQLVHGPENLLGRFCDYINKHRHIIIIIIIIDLVLS